MTRRNTGYGDAAPVHKVTSRNPAAPAQTFFILQHSSHFSCGPAWLLESYISLRQKIFPSITVIQDADVSAIDEQLDTAEPQPVVTKACARAVIDDELLSLFR